MGRPLPFVPEDLHRNGRARDAAVISLCRAAVATAIQAYDGVTSASDYARKMWSDDHGASLILRAAVAPATLTNTAALTQIGLAFLDVLTPMSAGADLLNRGLRLNFDRAAQLNVPGITLPTAGFVAEGAPVPVPQPTTSATVLTPHKLAAILVLTNEMLRSPSAEALVRQALVEATGPALDAALFGTAAATAAQPAGLRYNIAGLTPAAAGSAKSEVLVDDLQQLAVAIAPVSGNNNVVLVASPDASAALMMRLPGGVEWPVLTSSSLAARTVIAIATNAVVSAIDGAPVVDASRASAVHRETVPQDITGGTPSPAVPVTSIFQTDETGLRLRWPVTWALRDNRGLAWMTAVNW